MSTLITTLGGADAFVSRLDYLHESGLLYIGDEHAFLPSFSTIMQAAPANLLKESTSPPPPNTSRNGLAGNNDSGAMGSFIALSMLGIFPNPGQDVYFITRPFFASVSIKNPLTGNTATIRNVSFDGDVYKNIYIQNATLNGETYPKNYLTHSFFLEGGTLELTLGSVESETWGRGVDDIPPSYPVNGTSVSSMMTMTTTMI